MQPKPKKKYHLSPQLQRSYRKTQLLLFLWWLSWFNCHFLSINYHIRLTVKGFWCIYYPQPLSGLIFSSLSALRVHHFCVKSIPGIHRHGGRNLIALSGGPSSFSSSLGQIRWPSVAAGETRSNPSKFSLIRTWKCIFSHFYLKFNKSFVSLEMQRCSSLTGLCWGSSQNNTYTVCRWIMSEGFFSVCT